MDLNEYIQYNNFNGGIAVDFNNKIIYNYFNSDDCIIIDIDNLISRIRNNDGDYIEVSLEGKKINKIYSDRWGEEFEIDINNQDVEFISRLINGSIDKLKNELRYLQDRLSQTTVIYIKIIGGYKISRPPSNSLKFAYSEKVLKIKSYLEFLESIEIDKLIKIS